MTHSYGYGPANPEKTVLAGAKFRFDAPSPTGSWKVHALSLTVTVSVAYALCAIVDVMFPRFGLLAVLAPGSPLPIAGSPLAYLTGFALFTAAALVFGAVHGMAWDFWSKRLR